MPNLSEILAVQSYCFREFKPLPDLIAQVHALGLSRVELCGVHVDFNAPATHPGVLKQFAAAGLTIPSISVQTFRGDPAEEHWFAFAQAAGASMIAASFHLPSTPAAFHRAAKLADKYNLTLAIHNHGGYDWLGNLPMLSHLLATLPPRIGLCLDTAWCLQAAGNPVDWAEKLRPKLFGVHLKDFTFDSAGRWSDTIVGQGNLDLPAFLAAAKAAPNLTTFTLEYEADPANPVPKLKECLAVLRTALTP